MVAEARAFNAELERLLASMPKVHELAPAYTRQARREGRGVLPPPVFLDEARTVDARGVAVRMFEPADSRGASLHIHRGGWPLGAAGLQDDALSELARETP